MTTKQAVGIAVLTLASVGTSQAQTFSTWAPWEIDSVLTAWVLKRYVHPEATFQSLPKGTPISQELAIDIPTSPYRRGATYTTFDEAVRLHHIQTPCIARLTPLNQLLELAPWRKATDPAAEAFEAKLAPLLPREPTVGGLEAAFTFIDHFCQESNTP